ncbi:MAG TPA: glycosyltransferase [Dermatophilaceae bacterium]|nr:glycosyltransferase [Dermatophilaceae bacterium]
MTDVSPTAIVTATIPLTLASFHNELIRQLQQAGYGVTIVSSPGEALNRLESTHGVRAIRVAMAREMSPVADARAMRTWLRILRETPPQLIVAATPKASMLAMLAGRIRRVPRRLYYVGGLRLEGETGWRRAVLEGTERLTGHAATHIVGNSPSLVEKARQLGLYPAARLYQTSPGSSHGVDADHFSPRPQDPALRLELGLAADVPVLGFVGRLTRDKGVDTLLAALELLHRDGVSAQLLVVGSQIEPDSQHYASLLAGRGGCVLVGSQPDVRPYLALTDIHVLPSRREGFPNVVLEAAAMGKPTVTTDATGCIDAVVPEVTGLIVPVDDPRALADAIARLVNAPQLAARYGLAARQRAVQEYRPERVVASLLDPVLRPSDRTLSARLANPRSGRNCTRSAPPLVTVTPYGPRGASSRVRVFDWLDHLGMAAESHTYRGAADNRGAAMFREPVGTVRAERRIRELDVTGRTVVLSRQASPWSNGSVEERLLRSAGHGVYDVDDALFAHTSQVRRLLGLNGVWRRAVRAADVVIAGNDYLGEVAERDNDNVRVIPSCVDPSDYQRKESWELGDPPRLVWLGSRSTETYLTAIIPALREVARRSGARLTLVSSQDDNPALAPLSEMLDRVAWTRRGFAQQLNRADVAIGPLADTPWARGKCAYKLLQYAATGLPMVASPVGANASALRHFSGLAATTSEEWVGALMMLLEQSATQRGACGRHAAQAVAERYSFQAWSSAWRSAVDP